MSIAARWRGVYLLTADTADTEWLAARVAAALAGGAVMVQYRNKQAAPALAYAQAQRLRVLTRAHAVPLLINDDPELAVAVGAEGVHLGRDDGTLAAARRRLGAAAIIGVSCYGELDRARHLAQAGADYLAFGSFFASPTKPNAPRAKLELLAAARDLGLPLVAIGGIDTARAPALIAAGADLVAVISAVFDAADAEAATRQLADCFG